MSRSLYFAAIIALTGVFAPNLFAHPGHDEADTAISPAAIAPVFDENSPEAQFLSHPRQLTFAGLRSGEGYFSADGSKMIFQSERDADNPFYQIYVLDLNDGNTWRVTPGYGKTTCAWLHPLRSEVLYASTHLDPDARKKQEEELEFRRSGQQRRYSWDFDEHYDIFADAIDGGAPVRLTDALGYDAEGSWSPDGRLIAFASNRRAYSGELTPEEQELFAKDPASAVDVYIMDADGSNVRRLTDSVGYDGGPFFSADGKKITWRRFAKDGQTAEIFTMNIDGSDQRQITQLNMMSWAPYFHPSGDYLIFGTNVHGHANFELYIAPTDGSHEPVRVTHTDGFDSLPVFSPKGDQLSWTSTRGNNVSQIFLAAWDDQSARRALGLTQTKPQPQRLSAAISADDARQHVYYLASDLLQGRMTGTAGEQIATQYVAEMFAAFGLQPAGDNGTYFQEFSFTAGVSLGANNTLSTQSSGEPTPKTRELNVDWRPLAFSQVGASEASDVVFAGYGIVAPAQGEVAAYDSYAHLDVKDKWVLVLRFLPENAAPAVKQHLLRYADLRRKTTVARDLGARGIIFVSGPNAGANEQLIRLDFDAALTGSSIHALSVTDAVADDLFAGSGETLAALQSKLDSGDLMQGFIVPSKIAAAHTDLVHEQKTGRNVLARLQVQAAPSDNLVAIGAHIDHLGVGQGHDHGLGRWLQRQRFDDAVETRTTERSGSGIYYGADDNASGIAGLLEIAQRLAQQQAAGTLNAQRDILFAAWSGEELGLLGSTHFVKNATANHEQLYPRFVAYFNMDMIGRLREHLILGGIGSSSVWHNKLEKFNIAHALSLQLQTDPYLPTDSTAFYLAGVPILSAYTGTHTDYHTPNDTPDKINYEGLARVASLFADLVEDTATSTTIPDYKKVEQPGGGGSRFRVYLGTIPDYAASDVLGVLLAGVQAGSPADQAGVKAGDVIIELAGVRIENIYDYTDALAILKVGEATTIKIKRGDDVLTLAITPGSRE